VTKPGRRRADVYDALWVASLILFAAVLAAILLAAMLAGLLGRSAAEGNNHHAAARGGDVPSPVPAKEPRGGVVQLPPLRRTSAGPEADAVPRLHRFRVTAYCPCARCCGRWADGVTASGTRADHPLVAAPPSLPFGTRVRVPGYAGGDWVSVEDRGGAIQGARLDALFPSHAEALAWGVRDLTVEILEPPGDRP